MRFLFRVIVALHFGRKNVYSSAETLIFLHKLQAYRSGVLLERHSSRIKLRVGQQLLSKLPLFQPLEDSKRYNSGKRAETEAISVWAYFREKNCAAKSPK